MKTYRVPASVAREARLALKWHKEGRRGGTSVGLNTARLLASGRVSEAKVRHVAKYFPRHEVDKKGAGYRSGQPGYPSAGRVAWALWGGDPGWRWASAVVRKLEGRSSHGRF